jgi:nucleoside-diphosphate-sugar epimerase
VFFQLAGRSLVPLAGPANARAALIHVVDLVSLMTAMLESSDGGVWTASDDHPAGYTWREVLSAAAIAVGNPQARLFHPPAALLRALALAGDVGRMFGSASMLNSLKLRELRHPDWSVPAAERAAPLGWSPRFDLASGFTDAVAWYRNAKWIPSGQKVN